MDFSVVIPAYNAENTIESCVHALQAQKSVGGSFEIIVVDNGSTDRTGIVAKEAGATVIREEKRGPAAARNAGIKYATGTYICLTDADCTPLPDWIRSVSQKLLSQPDIIGSKGVYLTKQRSIVARFIQLEYEDKYDLLHGTDFIDFIDTYSACYRRDVLLANDGFDENMTYLEDQELSFRLNARGYKMVFEPSAVVYHIHSDTLIKYFRKKLTIGYWKAQVVRRFPNRANNDSHTPQVMKVQMGLALLLCASILSLFTLPLLSFFLPQALLRWLYWVPALFVLAFVATTIPFIRKGLPKDRLAALASPFLLFCRGLALGIGYIWGVLNPQKDITTAEVTTIGGFSYRLKRLFDILVASLCLPGIALSIPIFALFYRDPDSNSLFTTKELIGQEGKPIRLLRFQTKPGLQKRQFIRNWPLFWNVFKGDISLVGPTPKSTNLVTGFSDYQRHILSVKPGMTGPLQLMQKENLDLDIKEQIGIEIEYIHNYSFLTDLKMLFSAVKRLIQSR